MTKNLCVMPWIGMRIDPIGGMSPCCLYQPGTIKKPNGRSYNIHNDKLTDAIHSSELEQLRQSFLNGEKPAGCSKCWEEESAGEYSKRMRENQRYSKQYDSILQNCDNIETTHWDICLGVTCNLKCRICGPESSSRWLQDTKLAHAHFSNTDSTVSQEILTRTPSETSVIDKYGQWGVNNDLEFWEDFFAALKTAQTVEFYGGEPLYQKKHYEILDYCVQTGVAKNIDLHYNTNGTIYSDRCIKEVWPYFKSVSIMFSIDGVGDKFEYMRYPASWIQTNENLKRYTRNKPNNMTIQICPTSNMMSYFYMKELVDWAESINVPVWLNLLHAPEYFCIKNYPGEIKNLITANLTDDIFQAHNNFMMEENYDQLRRFFQIIDFWDKWRDQKFDEVFPELATYLRQNV